MLMAQTPDLLEGEKGGTHLYGTTEGDLAISLAEVHVAHTQVGALNEHREVHLTAAHHVALLPLQAQVVCTMLGMSKSAQTNSCASNILFYDIAYPHLNCLSNSAACR